MGIAASAAVRSCRRRSMGLWLGALVAAPMAAGCQPSTEVMSQQLSHRISLIDFSGLAPARPIGGLEASAAVPRSWQLLPPQTGAFYTHRQWRTANHSIAVGVVHLHMPLPMSAQTLVWLAKTKYGPDADKKADGGSGSGDAKPDEKSADGKSTAAHTPPGGKGRLLAEWTDSVGREWIEAENDKYHVRGYAVTCGFDAWLVYTGFRRHAMPNPVDLQLAGRSMESVVPDPLAPKK